eukprot:6178796-Pleurochrysis_carterae.AAC.3
MGTCMRCRMHASYAIFCCRSCQEFKFPKTIEEHEAKCREAESLKKRGNEFYQKGELVEAAKLYEQALPLILSPNPNANPDQPATP